MKFSEYREQKNHGTASFPMAYYFVDENHPQYVMPLHWHAEFEVLRVLRGRLVLYLNNEVYDLKSGDIVFIQSGTLHRGEPTDCAYDCAVFDLRIASGYNASRISELIRPITSSESTVIPICPEAEESASRLLDCIAKEGKYYELEASSLVSETVHRLYFSGNVSADSDENKRIAHRRSIINLLIDKIESEYTSKLTLSALAEIAGMNEKYLCRFFKSYTGSTPIDYVNRLRVDRACFDMTVNKMSVTEAAYECGFNELSYFIKTFKKYKGISPGQYKSRFGSISEG